FKDGFQAFSVGRNGQSADAIVIDLDLSDRLARWRFAFDHEGIEHAGIHLLAVRRERGHVRPLLVTFEYGNFLALPIPDGGRLRGAGNEMLAIRRKHGLAPTHGRGGWK